MSVSARNADVVGRLKRRCAGGHYSWPTLYEAVMGEPFTYECSPTESEAKFAERLMADEQFWIVALCRAECQFLW